MENSQVEARLRMTQAEFDEALRESTEYVYGLVRRTKPKGVIPTLVMHRVPFDEHGRIIDNCTDALDVMLMVDFDDTRSAKEVEGMGFAAGQKGSIVRAVFLITEAWQSCNVKVGDTGTYARPANDPERREIISVAGTTVDRRTCASHFEVKRSRSNRMIAIEQPSYRYYGSGVEVGGGMLMAFYYGYLRGLKAGDEKIHAQFN